MRQLSVSRPGSLVMLSSLSSALWMLRRIEGGGAATALTALKLKPLSLVKRGNSPRVKRCRSHVCNEGVLCCNDSALRAFHPPQWFYNFMIQISYLKSLYRVIPHPMVTNYPDCPLSCDAWCQDNHHQPLSRCHAPPDDGAVDWVFRMHGCCRGLGWAWSLIMFYRVTSQLGLSEPCSHSICSQALSYVTAPPPSSSSDSTLTTGCGFLWKTNSTIFQLELAKILALCKFCH